MKYLLFLILITMNMLLIGCQSKEYYGFKSLDFYKIISKNDKVIFQYRPQLDTLYYSPGLLIEDNENSISISIVKCSINKKCHVDLLSEQINGEYEVVLGSLSNKKIFIKDKDLTQELEFNKD